MKTLDFNLLTFVIGAVSTVAIITVAMYNHSVKQDELFARNMETAISKGVDPIAVKCSYGDARTEICITYILKNKGQ
jgi:hypothetical protein